MNIRRPPTRGKYDHTSLEVRDSNIQGLGLFVTANIELGTKLSPFDGVIYRADSDYQLPTEIRGLPIQIGAGLVQMATGYALFVAHKCNTPSAIIQLDAETGFFWVVARINLSAQAEVTIDYGTIQYPDHFTLYPAYTKCKCGDANCRGNRLGFESMPVPLRRSYRDEGAIPDWLWGLQKNDET